jgi:hypothetical protein
MPTTRRKMLLLSPVIILMGAISLVAQVSKHGVSTAVAYGLAGGALAGAALCVAVAFGRTQPAADKGPGARSREAQRVQSTYVPLGLAGAGLISLIGAIAGNGLQGVGTFLIVAASLLFAVLGVAVAALAVVRPQLWD